MEDRIDAFCRVIREHSAARLENDTFTVESYDAYTFLFCGEGIIFAYYYHEADGYILPRFDLE
jgi:hypothetical protein